jgi:hypothetical protein
MNLTLKEKQELGRSLIVLGRKLRDGVNPEVSEETLTALFSLAPTLPKADAPKFIRQPKTDDMMHTVLGWIRDGVPLPTGSERKAISNALIKLRRNGQIVNDGSVRSAKWRITTPEEQERIAKQIREQRKEYDLQRATKGTQ